MAVRVEERLPKLSRFLSVIYEKSSLQKKALKSFLDSRDELFIERAEEFAKKMDCFLKAQKISIEYIADAYLEMCHNMVREQTKFQRTGTYTCKSFYDAYSHVYLSEAKMASYMYGLALSQFLWPNHYKMYDFFISENEKIGDIGSYLEIGPGHGLYLAQAISRFSSADFTAIDISPVSARISKTIVEHFAGPSRCEFRVEDVRRISTAGAKFDYVVMCEVLEHLDEPNNILHKIRELLKDGGRLFITTCANCPAIDHVYLYESAEHIRRELGTAGYDIISDLVLPVNKEDEKNKDKGKIALNYAAVLKVARP